MPNRPIEESMAIRKWIEAALKDGASSPRKVQTWIEQNSEMDAPSIPTIAGIMKELGYKPIGYVWAKEGK